MNKKGICITGVRIRWKRNKTNRRLKLRIARLTKQAEDYAQQLSQQNWLQFCAQLQGTLSTRKTWHLLRSLMGTRQKKFTNQHNIRRLMHAFPEDEEGLLNTLRQRYERSPQTPLPSYSDYTGDPNVTLDTPFTYEELEAAIGNLTRNTAPGHDKITNRLIRNLPPASLDQLLNLINDHWTQGTLPPAWKHADISLIPKPGKPRYPTCVPSPLLHASGNCLNAWFTIALRRK